MSALPHVGVFPAKPDDVSSQRSVSTTVGTTIPNRISVDSDILDAVEKYSTLDEMQFKDSQFPGSDEYIKKDADRNVPIASGNKPGGPVSLTNGKVDKLRFPSLGAGYVIGPFGVTTSSAAVATATPQLIATFTTTIIPVGTLYRPMCFGSVLIASVDTGGRPIIEMRLGTTSSGTLLAVGRGRTMFTGPQGVPLLPVAETTGNTETPWMIGTGATVVVTLWLYDANGRSVRMDTAGDLLAGIFLLTAPVKKS